MSDKHTPRQPDANRDPISGAPGAHPGGVAAGGTLGAVAGAAVGSLFGPIGTLVGGAIGTLGGAAGGKAVAERVDPTVEVEYWRDSAPTRDYYRGDADYERDYAPAYRYGTEARNADIRAFDEAEPELRERWDTARGASILSWNEARPAVADAWQRTDQTWRTYTDVDAYYGEHYSRADYYSDDYSYDDYVAKLSILDGDTGYNSLKEAKGQIDWTLTQAQEIFENATRIESFDEDAAYDEWRCNH